LTGHDKEVTSVAVSADGHLAVSGGGSDPTVRVWDLEAGPLLHTLTGHDDWVTAVAVSADGRRAVSVDLFETVRMWNLAQGAELASFVSGHRGTVLAVTPAGTRAVVGTTAGPVHLLELCGPE
jgi:WD40 repeat protein